jgi:hypothetical protein
MRLFKKKRKSKDGVHCSLIIALLTFSSMSKAEEIISNKHSIIMTPFVSYRYDVFQWSALDNHNKPTELTWRFHIAETGLKIETVPEENQFNFLGQMKYGYILNNSKNQDSDWDDIGEYARSFSSIKGNTFDLSGAIGFSHAFKSMLITYYLGMDYNKYQTKNYGLTYTIRRTRDTHNSLNLGQTKTKSMLVSKYDFNNYAPWLGVSINYPINDNLSITPVLKLYLFYLHGKADWVLRKSLKHDPSFYDKALGIGASFDTKLLYKYSENLDFNINAGIKRFDMQKGSKKTFFSNGDFSTKKIEKLSLSSLIFSTGVRYNF